MNIVDEIKDALRVRTAVKLPGRGGGGCINKGEAYQVDGEKMVFVKTNDNDKARVMFEGELVGLKYLLATKCVRAPQPYCVISNPTGGPGSAGLIMEYVQMIDLKSFQSKLGENLAALHCFNEKLGIRERKDLDIVGRASGSKKLCTETKIDDEKAFDDVETMEMEYVNKFGFDVATCCGYLELVNDWCDDWVTFYARNRLDHQFGMIQENYGDREVVEHWSKLQLTLPKFFTAFEDKAIVPALLHGDLWSGNAAEVDDGPIIFDPAVFYGHAEFDLSIATLFGGFSRTFYDSYHKIRRKADGFELRSDLYQLFHYINHWNHFGSGYKSKSLTLLRKLNSKFK